MQVELTPTTLRDLLALSFDEMQRVDIGRMNLLCSEGLPEVGLSCGLKVLNQLAEAAKQYTACNWHLLRHHGDVLRNSEVVYRIYCLSRSLRDGYRIHYCREERDYSLPADWGKADRHFMFGCLGPQRHGTCASLPALFVAVGRRLGYPLNLVHSPSHVFCRWEEPERHNIEFNGDDFDLREYEEYLTIPVQWDATTIAQEKGRKLPLFLRSLLPQEIVAAFLAQRGHYFEDIGIVWEARRAYHTASQLAPHNPTYEDFLVHCNRNHAKKILSPWGVKPDEFCMEIERRLKGGNPGFHRFPWEGPGGAPIPGGSPYEHRHGSPVYNFLANIAPPETSPASVAATPAGTP